MPYYQTGLDKKLDSVKMDCRINLFKKKAWRDQAGGQGALFLKRKESSMYILAATGGPSYVVHTIVALGAAVIAGSIALIRKIRRHA